MGEIMTAPVPYKPGTIEQRVTKKQARALLDDMSQTCAVISCDLESQTSTDFHYSMREAFMMLRQAMRDIEK